ncbi:hypothetical protein EIP86_003777 [Pleurotus ostreatoroseus]|nr:hypothetical protein EIP86_003777 [Pleurotus ostreatoroseus]
MSTRKQARSKGSRLVIEVGDRSDRACEHGAALHIEGSDTLLGPQHVRARRAVSARTSTSTSSTSSQFATPSSPLEDSSNILHDDSLPFCDDQNVQFVLDAVDASSSVAFVRAASGTSIRASGTAEYCSWKAKTICIHRDVFEEHYLAFFALESLSPFPPPPAIYFHTTPFKDAHVFSCISSTGRFESGKRSIVSLQRDGRWHCESCGYSPVCKHVPHAVAFATLAGIIPDSNTSSHGSDESRRLEYNLDVQSEEEIAALLEAGTSGLEAGLSRSISHIPVRPPRWCSLPSEPSFKAPVISSIIQSDSPTVLNLDESARCCCGLQLHNTDHGLNINTGVNTAAACVSQPAIIYGLTKRYDAQVKLIPCPNCRHSRRCIGPDLGVCGLFNLNNTMIFTHELLNAYTNAYTASETPFAAFCLTVRRAYEEHGFQTQFCANATFVRAWFAFTAIQTLDSGMYCPQCGSSPSIVIVDGISLATHTSKLIPTVRPPTYTDEHSEINSTISSYKARQLPAIPQVPLRAVAKQIINEIAGTAPIGELKPDTIVDLNTRYPAFAAYLSMLNSRGRHSAMFKPCRDFALQIIAPDIVLQLVPVSAIPLLQAMANPMSEPPSWLQSLCPALGSVINSHVALGAPLPLEVRHVAVWLAHRAQEVYDRLAQHEPGIIQSNIPPEPWQQTGTYYGLPAVRRRRVYSKLRYDSHRLDRDEDQLGDCNKFYKTYSKNNLTGGIFVIWCSHSICLGFHSIPVAEGRNDVFSAIYTRFPNAPDVIIYDFACQLAPYCFVREAQYFRNTRFLIDELHAHDHTRCGEACFASNAMRYDERVRAANTSAAECGNKGMRRIRKSVSFMTHEHAVCFTKVFLDIWNRNIMRRMLSAQ